MEHALSCSVFRSSPSPVISVAKRLNVESRDFRHLVGLIIAEACHHSKFSQNLPGRGKPLLGYGFSTTCGRHVSSGDLSGQTFEIPKKAFILKLDKVKSDDDFEEEKESKPSKKKNSQVITLIPLDRSGVVKSANDKNSELMVLQDLLGPRTANISEGSIGIGKLGSSKKGKLRFRIASGNIFSHSKAPKLCSVGVAATQSVAVDVDNLTTLSNDSCSNPEEMTTKESKDATSELTTTEMTHETTEATSTTTSEEPSTEPPNKKMSIVRIFKQMAEQFEQLQDLIMDDQGSEPFNRYQARMTLENVCCAKGNVTRVKFIRRKASDQVKKKCVLKGSSAKLNEQMNMLQLKSK